MECFMGKDWFVILAASACAMGLSANAFAASYTPPSAAVSKINSYRGYSELTTAANGMDIDQYTYNMTTWQISNGGFYKAMADSYKSAYKSGNKSEWRSKDGGDLGTIDNNATIQEMRLLAIRYKETTNSNYKSTFKSSFNKALNFLLSMQRSTGGLPQVWPKRGNYSDHVTLNDNAMIRAMVTMMDIANKASPFDTDIIDDATRGKMQKAMDKAIDYLIRAQIVNNGNPTVWCAQHDTVNYAPRSARAYELESKSGSESAGVVWFLMNWPKQTPAIQAAVKGAIAWYKKTKVSNLKFNKGNFEQSAGASMWYRFYEVNNDNYFFCDRDGASTKTQDITKISEERRTGYQWAGDYGSALLKAEADYMNAIANISIAEEYGPNAGTPASSSSISSSSIASSSSVSSSSIVASSSSIENPAVVDCGGSACTTTIQGDEFISIDGVSESKNAGFSGTGYANVDNAEGTTVTYGVTVPESGLYSIYIRFANGGSSSRNISISAGETTVANSIELPSTGAWTTWNMATAKIQLSKGNSKLTLKSLTADGMANIDFIGLKIDEQQTLGITSSVPRANNSAGATMQIRDIKGNLVKSASHKGVYLITIKKDGKTLKRTLIAK